MPSRGDFPLNLYSGVGLGFTTRGAGGALHLRRAILEASCQH